MLLPYLMQDTKRIRVVGSVRLANNQDKPPTKLDPKAQPTEQHTSHCQPHPSPPRPDTSSQSQLNTSPTPPALPAFPILQTRSNKPTNQHPAEQQHQQEGHTEYSPTLHFTIKEQSQAPEPERQQQEDTTGRIQHEPPEHPSSLAKEKQRTAHTTETVQQISSGGEEDDDQEMAEQSDQDVDMESAHRDTEEADYPREKPTSITNNTNQEKEYQNTQAPPQQEDQQATKDMQQDQEQRRHATGREVMQTARPLQMLRKNPEQPHHALNPATQTPARDNEVQPCPTPQDPNSKQDSDPISLPTTADAEQPTNADHSHHHGATTTTSLQHQDTTTTKEHLHTLYTSACDELGIPDKATNTSMQRMASKIYQDILSYADHLMAILRILTLAKNTTTKSGRQAKTPLTQLLYIVSRGWTLDQGQHNQMQEGMSRMGLAICLTQLLTQDQLQAGQSDLTSFYIDYIYRLSFLQQQYHPPLFFSQRRHCGHNLHAIQLVDPVLVNTTNNSEHQLRQGDLHILLMAAKSEYEKRHWNKQCDTCYKPGLARREWKPITGQFAILQLRPASGDRYLPVTRSDKHQQDHNILHNLRGRKAMLWNKEYAVAGCCPRSR